MKKGRKKEGGKGREEGREGGRKTMFETDKDDPTKDNQLPEEQSPTIKPKTS